MAQGRFTDVRRFDTIDSTNRYLLELAAAGAPDGVVAVADTQTAGRGRLGRTWVAPPGASLLVSVLLRQNVAVTRAHLLTVAAGLAAIDAVRSLAAIDAQLKWPNDVVVDDRKLAGILAEANGDAVVLGMGLNVHWTDFPPEIAQAATACNLESDIPVDRDALLDAWLATFAARLQDLDRVARDAVHASATLGRRVRVELPAEHFEAHAIALTPEGHLLVRRADGAEVSVAAGDVVHLRIEGAGDEVAERGREAR
ncbi:MAG TPA: biotin--[acetyl-CoA-carboxylase] ligase [Acidimicrobiia bacterium]|nr:biotin--[acetyl-CoA-carboxylase] ligase [Acidimicrobiia bacterium]